MKKFIVGTLFGFILATAVGANAAELIDNIVGKTVQGSFPVKVDGKPLTTQAAVIDGTSYLPVRAIGDALNKDVTFNADLGIELKTKEVAKVTESPLTAPTPAEESVNYYKMLLQTANANVRAFEDNIKNKPEDKEQFQPIIDELKLKIAEYEVKITELQQ